MPVIYDILNYAEQFAEQNPMVVFLWAVSVPLTYTFNRKGWKLLDKEIELNKKLKTTPTSPQK